MELIEKYIAEGAKPSHEISLSAKINELKEKNLTKLRATEIPHRKVEDWKYTNIKGDLKNDFTYSPSGASYEKSQNHNFIHLYFKDGQFLAKDSDKVELEISPLDSTQDQNLLKIFEFQSYFKNDFSLLLNRANLALGNIIKIKAKTQIKKPILIHHFFSGEFSFYNYNSLYLIEESSQLTVLEKVESEAEVFLNYSTDIIQDKNSYFEHTIIQDTKQGSLVLANLNAKIQKDAEYRNITFQTGAKTSRQNLFIDLVHEGACAHAHGLYALHSNQHHDTMSYIKHSAAHTQSHQLYKGILNDESRGVFTGRVRVEKDSQLINANQLNKNLLLTKKAKVNSRPQLEIYADDVKCSHGSTTGQLNDDELFYFETRGITKQRARQILARAFAYDVVLQIKNITVRDILKEHLLSKHIVS